VAVRARSGGGDSPSSMCMATRSFGLSARYCATTWSPYLFRMSGASTLVALSVLLDVLAFSDFIFLDVSAIGRMTAGSAGLTNS
jgi:hypothetical protein